jgi:diacylglycerol kinase (ATP)
MKSVLPLMIVNPKSGRGMKEKQWAARADAIRAHFGPFEVEFTKGPGDAIQIAEQESSKRDLIVGVGGDGTISEIANGILKAKSQTALGLLPGGSGGDFHRTLNIPRSFVDAAKRLKEGSDHLMDAGKLSYVDHQGREQTRFFVNTASFGISGAVASRANRSTKRFGGTLTYATATMRTVMTFDAPEVELQIDEEPLRLLKILVVCVANGTSFGGGMRIAPDAKLDDGLFDVLIARNIRALKLLMSSHRLYAGTHLSMADMALIRGRKISATPTKQNQQVLLEVDGETPGRLPATMEILPRVLRVRC